MAGIPVTFLSGGAGATPEGSAKPSLTDVLRAMNGDEGSGIPAWTTGITVTTHVAVLATAGWVIAVEGTTGDSVGPKQMVQSGSPAQGEVDVQYDADGVATLTFNTTDAITACAVVVRPTGANLL